MSLVQEHYGTVTVKGQITIPIEVRRLLGVKPHDKLVFEIRDGKVELRPTTMTLQDVCGAVLPLERPVSPEAMHDILDQELAERWLTHDK